MCDRSKWKPRSYCYSTKKIKSVPTTKWERQIPKDEDYWRQYVRKEEKDLIVRDSYPNLTRFPSIHRYPQTLYHGIRNDDNDDSNNIDDLARNEGKPFVESLTNFRSCRLSSFSKENDLVSIGEPMATFFPPTPSKRPTKTFSTREEEYERVLAENMSLRKGRSSPIPVNARYASSENAKVYKTYLKKNRSLHENDRPTGTCRNDGKSSTSRTKKTLLKATNKNDLKSIGKLVDRIELSDYFDFNRESLTFDDTDDRFDLRSRITRNEDNGPIRYTSDLENKFECTISNVRDAKHTERNKRSSSDGDFLKYSVRYAREALESLTKDLRPGLLRLGINETTKEVGPLETMDDTEKYEKKFLNISPVSLKPLSSRDRVTENEDYLPRTSLTEDFLNGLPKMSYFPRKKRDRCLSCLYKSLEEIVGVSTRKDAYERRKEREEGRYIGKYKENISVECESNGDVSFAEFKEERNQSDLGGAREEVGVTTKRNDSVSSDDSIAEENKFDLPSTQRENGEERTSVDEVKETEGRLPVPELESTGPDDKRITFKSISVSSDRSKCLVTSSSDEDDPPSVARVEEYSSTKSKYMPACHAPTILSHTLEPLRALKLRKSTGMRARMAFDETTDESPTLEPDEKSREIASRETTPMDTKRGTTEGDSKSIKKLIKVKSVSENLITDADDVNEAKEKSLFGRSFSCRNLEWILRDSTKGTTDRKSPGLPTPVPEDGPFRPLFSKEEIEETLKNFEERNASPTFALSTLCDMFLNRILESNDKSRDRRRDNIAKRLVKLLVESRRYSNPDKFPSDLIFSSKQRPLLNGQRLRRILPLDSYNLIAPLLGMPEHYPSLPVALSKIERPESTKERSDRSDLIEEIMDDLIVHPPSSRDGTIPYKEIETTRYNPYELFMKKARRKAVVWRPLTEYDLKGYDPQATLRMRADKITTDICKEFCDWLRSLGGLEKSIDERVLKNMFEISFSADACKTTQISVKEMATVPTDVALARLCHGASVLATTRKQLERDAKAESRPKRTLAFGTSMPTDLLFIPPTNRVRETWLKCKSVPRELETMDLVWDGIIHLESVEAFAKWLRRHPKVSPPEIFKRGVLPKAIRKSVKKRNTEI